MAVNGNIIKQLRKEAGLTQGELGKKLGVVKQTISSWENNVSEPNSETLSELSKLFGVSVAQLYDHGVQILITQTSKWILQSLFLISK